MVARREVHEDIDSHRHLLAQKDRNQANYIIFATSTDSSLEMLLLKTSSLKKSANLTFKILLAVKISLSRAKAFNYS